MVRRLYAILKICFRKKLLFFNTVVFSFNLICKYVVANKMIEKMKLGLLSLFEI